MDTLGSILNYSLRQVEGKDLYEFGYLVQYHPYLNEFLKPDNYTTMEELRDYLDKVIDLDIPFLKDARTARIANLDELLLRADITTAEKFRKVFEAYQIEANFGKTIENYPGYIVLDGNELAVDFFRLGRLGLYYRTPNGKETGFWNINTNSWSHEGGSRAKTPLGGPNMHEGVNLWKKVFNESFSATSITP